MTKEDKLAIARSLLAEAEAEAKTSRSTETTWKTM